MKLEDAATVATLPFDPVTRDIVCLERALAEEYHDLAEGGA